MPINKLKEILKERIMALAALQVNLLCLTTRKADVEYGLSINALEKMQITRESSKLAQEYNSKLKMKDVVRYSNGQCINIDYGYLMGYGSNFSPIINGTQPVKENPLMMLADYKGQVVLSSQYANAIVSVLGSSIMDSNGRGGTFSQDKIPEIMSALFPGFTPEEIEEGVETYNWSATTVNTVTGEETGSTTVDTADLYNQMLQKIVDFYLPIFQAAASNGWTTEYNDQIAQNDRYISDSIFSGTFQLIGVDYSGNYDERTSLEYFVTVGEVQTMTTAETRENVTSWYNLRKAEIKEKEDYLDIEKGELDAELEATKVQIESTESLIKQAMESFNFNV